MTKEKREMSRDANEKLTAVRITSFEVAKVGGEGCIQDWKETTMRWHKLADEIKGISNCFWQTWEVWHVTHESREKLKQWLDDRLKLGIKAAGKCKVLPMPSVLSKAIWQAVRKAFPDAHSRVASLTLNTLARDLMKHKASKGSLPGHSAILLYHQSRPSFARPQPIPFSSSNCTIVPPPKPGGNFELSLRITLRAPRKSISDLVELRCKGRRVQSQVAIIRRIVSGEFKFCGSQLIYSMAKRKWFAQIAYRMPIKPRLDLDVDKSAVLYARKDWPWTIILKGARKMPGGRGRYVEPVRKSLLMQRWDRQANYKNAGHANKGHGRTRATKGQAKLRQAWKNFTKRVNHGVTNEAVEWCLSRGIGTLIYVQPEGDFAAGRFLHNAGKVGDRTDSTGWPWFDVKTLLEYKCQQNGIKLVTKKRVSGSFSKRNGVKAVAAQRVAPARLELVAK